MCMKCLATRKAFTHAMPKAVISVTVRISSIGPATLIADMRASPLRDHLRTLTLRGDLGALDSLAPLAAFAALRTLDMRECFGEVPDEALQRLRERGITVRLPLPPQDDPNAGMVFQVDEIVEQGGGGK